MTELERAKVHPRHLLDEIARLRAELAEAQHDTIRAMSEVRRLEAAARRDAEEIERLREAVTFYATALPLAYEEDAGYTARAALAPRQRKNDVTAMYR